MKKTIFIISTFLLLPKLLYANNWPSVDELRGISFTCGAGIIDEYSGGNINYKFNQDKWEVIGKTKNKKIQRRQVVQFFKESTSPTSELDLRAREQYIQCIMNVIDKITKNSLDQKASNQKTKSILEAQYLTEKIDQIKQELSYGRQNKFYPRVLEGKYLLKIGDLYEQGESSRAAIKYFKEAGRFFLSLGENSLAREAQRRIKKIRGDFAPTNEINPLIFIEDNVTFGIGVGLNKINDMWKIVGFAPNSPAKRMGISLGDQIYRINDRPVPKKIDDLIDLIVGDIGTVVTITIKRDNNDEESTIQVKRELPLKREIDGSYHIYDGIISQDNICKSSNNGGRTYGCISENGFDKVCWNDECVTLCKGIQPLTRDPYCRDYTVCYKNHCEYSKISIRKGRFVRYHNKTVRDVRTNHTWYLNTIKVSWNELNDWITKISTSPYYRESTCDVGRYKGTRKLLNGISTIQCEKWRIPTLEELSTILDEGKINNIFNSDCNKIWLNNQTQFIIGDGTTKEIISESKDISCAIALTGTKE